MAVLFLDRYSTELAAKVSGSHADWLYIKNAADTKLGDPGPFYRAQGFGCATAIVYEVDGRSSTYFNDAKTKLEEYILTGKASTNWYTDHNGWREFARYIAIGANALTFGLSAGDKTTWGNRFQVHLDYWKGFMNYPTGLYRWQDTDGTVSLWEHFLLYGLLLQEWGHAYSTTALAVADWMRDNYVKARLRDFAVRNGAYCTGVDYERSELQHIYRARALDDYNRSVVDADMDTWINEVFDHWLAMNWNDLENRHFYGENSQWQSDKDRYEILNDAAGLWHTYETIAIWTQLLDATRKPRAKLVMDVATAAVGIPSNGNWAGNDRFIFNDTGVSAATRASLPLTFLSTSHCGGHFTWRDKWDASGEAGGRLHFASMGVDRTVEPNHGGVDHADSTWGAVEGFIDNLPWTMNTPGGQGSWQGSWCDNHGWMLENTHSVAEAHGTAGAFLESKASGIVSFIDSSDPTNYVAWLTDGKDVYNRPTDVYLDANWSMGIWVAPGIFFIHDKLDFVAGSLPRFRRCYFHFPSTSAPTTSDSAYTSEANGRRVFIKQMYGGGTELTNQNKTLFPSGGSTFRRDKYHLRVAGNSATEVEYFTWLQYGNKNTPVTMPTNAAITSTGTTARGSMIHEPLANQDVIGLCRYNPDAAPLTTLDYSVTTTVTSRHYISGMSLSQNFTVDINSGADTQTNVTSSAAGVLTFTTTVTGALTVDIDEGVSPPSVGSVPAMMAAYRRRR